MVTILFDLDPLTEKEARLLQLVLLLHIRSIDKAMVLVVAAHMATIGSTSPIPEHAPREELERVARDVCGILDVLMPGLHPRVEWVERPQELVN